MKSKTFLLNQIDSIQKFAHITTGFIEDIDLVRGRYTIDAKSIMGIFSLDLSKAINVVIHTDNDDRANQFFTALEDAGIHEVEDN